MREVYRQSSDYVIQHQVTSHHPSKASSLVCIVCICLHLDNWCYCRAKCVIKKRRQHWLNTSTTISTNGNQWEELSTANNKWQVLTYVLEAGLNTENSTFSVIGMKHEGSCNSPPDTEWTSVLYTPSAETQNCTALTSINHKHFTFVNIKIWNHQVFV